MMKYCIWFFAAVSLTGAAFLFLIDPALAGEPLPWQKGLQPAATPVMERVHDFHNLLLAIITAIALFVIALMAYILLRFSARRNPEPSKTTHNVPLEVVWTVIPIVILIVIAVPSFNLLYYMNRFEDAEMTVKVTGYQWYWGYEYPDHDGLAFAAYMIPDEEIDESKGQQRLLSTDTQLVLPVDTVVRIQVTAADVLHSFAVPAFGIKTDAVPGRLNETWVKVTQPGTYFGMCSELCGVGHAFMPSEVRVVPKEDFEAWVAQAADQHIPYDDFLASRGDTTAQTEEEGQDS